MNHRGNLSIAARVLGTAVFLIWLTWLAPSLAAQDGHPDVYSIELAPTPDLRDVRGVVRLRWAESPFGISVSKEGHQRYALELQETIALTRHRVLRAPRCHACGVRIPPPSPWFREPELEPGA